MWFLSKKAAIPAAIFNTEKNTPFNMPATRSVNSGHESPDPLPVVQGQQDGEKPKLTVLAVLLGAIASMGGFIFGYESGQISGTSYSSLAALAEIYR
jgi:SP family sugar:H+ symporter-like MFS transporter